MGRISPLGIEGTALSFRDPDLEGRFTVAMARAKDESGAWQVKRFQVTSWRRDGVPVIPEAAKDWVKQTRTSFIKGESVAKAGTFQEFASLLVESLGESVNPGRLAMIKAISAGLARAGISDMRTDTFPIRLRKWIEAQMTGWSLAKDATNRRKNPTPLAPATKNALLIMCRQVTRLAVAKRRLSFDPLAEIKPFKEPRFIKPVFTIDELRFMVSDEARDHAANAVNEVERLIESTEKGRAEAVRAIAKARGCHWTSIYNLLKKEPRPDPFWLPTCILALTGMRADEAMHLRWEWIHWKADQISLKLADDYESKADAERIVPLEPELREILLPLAKPAGHILDAAIRSGSSGARPHLSKADGNGSRDYTAAFRLYLKRIGIDPKDRTMHSLRHNFISLKMAREDTNLERLRKAVGHADISTTQGYAQLSQLFESEVDQWPDRTLWLRRSIKNQEKSRVN